MQCFDLPLSSYEALGRYSSFVSLFLHLWNGSNIHLAGLWRIKWDNTYEAQCLKKIHDEQNFKIMDKDWNHKKIALSFEKIQMSFEAK